MSWEKYWDKRVEKVKENAPVDEVLEHYNISLRREDTEVQFPCPLHGDGKDKRKSARYYPRTNSTYCWACKKARDPIEWVRDYEKKRKGNPLEFHEALQQLEQRFDISPPPPPEDTKDPSEEQEDYVPKELQALNQMAGGDEAALRDDDVLVRKTKEVDEKLQRLICNARENPDLMDPILKLGYLLDGIRYDYVHGKAESEKVEGVIEKLEAKVESIRENI